MYKYIYIYNIIENRYDLVFLSLPQCITNMHNL